MSATAVLLLGLVVLLTHGLETVTGFGCTVLALPFACLLLDVKEAVVVLSVLAWLLALYIVTTKFRKIRFREYGVIVGLVGLGLPIGMYFFHHAPTGLLKRMLGGFVVAVSVWELARSFRGRGMVDRIPERVLHGLLFVGGIVHGTFASGGPLVVLYATRKLRDKGEFRATLCLLWATLNTVLMVSFVATGKITAAAGWRVAALVPFLAAAIAAGELIHDRVNEAIFRRIVFGALLVSGAVMFL